jgi:hypothetical protein
MRRQRGSRTQPPVPRRSAERLWHLCMACPMQWHATLARVAIFAAAVHTRGLADEVLGLRAELVCCVSELALLAVYHFQCVLLARENCAWCVFFLYCPHCCHACSDWTRVLRIVAITVAWWYVGACRMLLCSVGGRGALCPAITRAGRGRRVLLV